MEHTELMSRIEAAEMLHIRPRTMTLWRKRGYGPLAISMGAHTYYRAEEVRAFLAGRIEKAEADQAARAARRVRSLPGTAMSAAEVEAERSVTQ